MRTQHEAQQYWDGYKVKELTLAGRLLYHSGIVAVYSDGDTFSMLFRWWHPGTWVVWASLIFIAPVIAMFTEFTVISIYRECSFRPSQYFRQHPDQLFFVR